MKILVIGDPHGRLPKGLTQIVKKNKIEVIVCLGDIPPVPKNKRDPKAWENFRTRADKKFDEIVKKMCSYGLPVLTLMGNMYRSPDGMLTAKKIFRKYKNLIYREADRVRINSGEFVFFDMTFEFHSHKSGATPKERRKEKNLRLEKKLNKNLKMSKVPVVIAHAPPFGVLDRSDYSNSHVGSKILLRAIKKYQPKLVLCGHIHEGKGKAKIGKTTVINAGCCGDYFIIDI